MAETFLGPLTTTVVGTAYWTIMLGIIALALLLVKCFCPKGVSMMISSIFSKFCCGCRRSMNRQPPETSDSSSPIIRRRNLRLRTSMAGRYQLQEIEAAAARPAPRILSSSSEESSPLPRVRAATFGGATFGEIFSRGNSLSTDATSPT
jgi:hypothetical protein